MAAPNTHPPFPAPRLAPRAECTGGPEKLLEHDLPRRYTTYCDPRLNYAQGMELSLLMAQYLAEERTADLAAESGVPAEAFIGSDGPAFGEEGAAGDAAQPLLARSHSSGSSLGWPPGVAGGGPAAPGGPPPLAAGRPQLGLAAAAGGGSTASLGGSSDAASDDGGGGGGEQLSARSGRPRFAAGRGERPVLDTT